MIIRNKTRNNDVCWYKRSTGILGLMFKKRIPDGFGLLIKHPTPNNPGIHTWFCFFTINLYFIDANGIVVDIKTLSPWNKYTPKKEAKWILETIRGGVYNQVCIGDELVFDQTI